MSPPPVRHRTSSLHSSRSGGPGRFRDSCRSCRPWARCRSPRPSRRGRRNSRTRTFRVCTAGPRSPSNGTRQLRYTPQNRRRGRNCRQRTCKVRQLRSQLSVSSGPPRSTEATIEVWGSKSAGPMANRERYPSGTDTAASGATPSPRPLPLGRRLRRTQAGLSCRRPRHRSRRSRRGHHSPRSSGGLGMYRRRHRRHRTRPADRRTGRSTSRALLGTHTHRQRTCRNRTRPSMRRNCPGRSEGPGRNRRWVRPCRPSHPRSNARGIRFAPRLRRAPPCRRSGRGREERRRADEQPIHSSTHPPPCSSVSEQRGSRVRAISGRTPCGQVCALGDLSTPPLALGPGLGPVRVVTWLVEAGPRVALWALGRPGALAARGHAVRGAAPIRSGIRSGRAHLRQNRHADEQIHS